MERFTLPFLTAIIPSVQIHNGALSYFLVRALERFPAVAASFQLDFQFPVHAIYVT
ncbi:hypothetical protein BgiMline_012811, partial [Biomphalaria glabrata]